ncbi:hypothetical protein DPEC_G00100490 [Dallia pectoralis]|uniref:Uncharacterized protein n=1 Tax=Dallia pectoralis TaxID=75939 RepID=A0ACC2GWC7_DALPE|nr:hypothetical protein DPEC_G00100490 [Dallia pectoralis]
MADSAMTGVVTSAQTTLAGGGHGVGDMRHPEYIAFVLVPVFFLLGLLGVLICHVLMRKGYRCTTEAEDEEEAQIEAQKEKDLEMAAEMNDTYIESNNDTVGQIVHYIMKNEANSDALKAMVTNTSIDSDGPPLTPTSPTTPTTPTTPGTPLSPGAPAGAAKHTCSHLHTVGGIGANRHICHRCNHKKWPLVRRMSNKKTLDRRSHGEVTVLAVGRFRVTKRRTPRAERPPSHSRIRNLTQNDSESGSFLEREGGVSPATHFKLMSQRTRVPVKRQRLTGREWAAVLSIKR